VIISFLRNEPVRNVLLTGGTGTLGHAILEQAKRDNWPARFTVYSRSELSQARMRAEYPDARYVLGDVRDRDRIAAATAGHDVVLHLAAMKRVPECEEQPGECLQTNVIGTWNVMHACQAAGVERCVIISTDKACRAVTTYGASKRLAEGLVAAAPPEPTTFTAVRYGNVVASNGSVIPLWRKQASLGQPLTITDHRMTRFWMSTQDAVNLVCYALQMPAGTIVVPKMGAMSILDMALAIAPVSETVETGLRSLEKMHEDLVAPDELAVETPTHFHLGKWGDPVTGYSYTSRSARRLSADEFLAMLEPEAVPA
jgi:UDP-N-acetylglucosamine 4,6-dehydratase